MLRFFRTLRQRLLTENKFSKYLLYAVGEIALVMIGILLALQVNNWNEDRKLQEQEIILLGDMKSDLQETLKELQFGKSLQESTVTNYRILLKAIDNDEPYSGKIDSASVYINFFHVPKFRRTTYETLKSQGEILSNDTLKKAISNVYDRMFVYMTEDQLKVEWSIYNQQTLRYNEKYLRYKDLPFPAPFPVDFERMKSDDDFINYLSGLIGFRTYGITVYDNTIEEIQTVIAAIDQEMERLKN